MDALVFIIGIFMHGYGRVAIRLILIRAAGLSWSGFSGLSLLRILRTISLRAARVPVP